MSRHNFLKVSVRGQIHQFNFNLSTVRFRNYGSFFTSTEHHKINTRRHPEQRWEIWCGEELQKIILNFAIASQFTWFDITWSPKFFPYKTSKLIYNIQELMTWIHTLKFYVKQWEYCILLWPPNWSDLVSIDFSFLFKK